MTASGPNSRKKTSGSRQRGGDRSKPRGPGGDNQGGKVRLQRLMADAGVASRRECERMIEDGQVRVNGETVFRLPVLVDPRVDTIEVNSRPLRKPEPRLYLMMYKPARVLCTTKDDPAFSDAKGQGRPTIMDLVIHPGSDRLFPVGRLGFHATGLVLLTNDGDIANLLTHPRHRVPKTYEVLVRRIVRPEELPALAKALTQASMKIPDEVGEPVAPKRRRGPTPLVRRPRPAPVEVELVKVDGDRSVLRLTMQEGPNRSVEEVLARLGLHVKGLRRVGIGPLSLRGVALGQWRPLTTMEITQLRKLGKAKTGQKRGSKPGQAPPGPGRRAAAKRPGAGVRTDPAAASDAGAGEVDGFISPLEEGDFD